MPGSALKKPAAAAILKRPAGKTGMTVRKAGMTARQTGMSARKAGMTAREVGTTARQAGLVGRESAAQEKAGPSSARVHVSANAYMMWRKAAGNGMTNKQAGASWKSMSDEEKLPWKTAFTCGKIEKLEQQHGMRGGSGAERGTKSGWVILERPSRTPWRQGVTPIQRLRRRRLCRRYMAMN